MTGFKKMLIALPVVVITLLLMTGIVYGESKSAGVINADTVNLRSEPETSAKIIIQLSKDSKVTIIKKSNDWYNISFNDTDGWVFAQFVDVKDSVIETGIVNATNVNVRSKPDIDSEIITRLDKGTSIQIYEISGKWARFLVDEDNYGWMSMDFVTLKRDTAASRGLVEDVSKLLDEVTETDEEKDSNDENIRQKIVDYAKKFLGVRYKYGGTTAKGFDCSGYVQYVFKHFGIKLERTSADQGNHGTKINKQDLKPGDLVFFDTNGGHNAIEHVGIYIGNGRFIHASSGSGTKCVTISPLNQGFYSNTYMRSRRYIKD